MNKKTKKLTVVVIQIIFCLFCLFAGGEKEKAFSGTAQVAGSKNASSMEWIILRSDGAQETRAAKEGETPPYGAIGIIYKNSSGSVVKTSYFDSDEAWLSRWITYIADAIDQVTFRIALAINPFPTTMFQLYNVEISGLNGYVSLKMTPNEEKLNNFSPDYLLISNSYYNTSNLKANQNGAQSWKIPIGEDANGTGTETLQFGKWKTISLLFVCCFVAEILFTAVYGYASGSSEEGGVSLLKGLARKIAVTVMLFILIASLPFLLEAFRYGLFKVADAFYGSVSEYYYKELVDYGAGTGNPLGAGGTQNCNIFELPGFFIRSMKELFTKITADVIRDSLTSAMSKTSGSNSIKSLIIGFITFLLSLMYRFFMFVMVLKAAIHIARNVLEVYLLIGLAMILTPFTVFLPTKTLGSKCIMSLITNVIECFVILVIILTLIPAIKITVVSMLDTTTLISRSGTFMKTATYTPYVNGSKGESQILKMIAGDSYIITIASIGREGDRLSVLWTSSEADSSEIKDILESENVKFRIDVSGVARTFNANSKELPVGLKAEKYGTIPPQQNFNYQDGKLISADKKGKSEESCYYPIISQTHDSLTTLFIKAINKQSLEDWDKASFDRKRYFENIWNSVVGEISGTVDSAPPTVGGDNGNGNTSLRLDLCSMWDFAGDSTSPYQENNSLYQAYPAYVVFTDYNPSAEYNINTTEDQATALMFMRFTLIFLGLFLPCFFVQQSTHITNALMNGNAGLESIANATNDVTRQMGDKIHDLVGPIRAIPKAMYAAIKENSSSSGNSRNSNTAAKDIAEQNSKN